MLERLGSVLLWTGFIVAGCWLWVANTGGLLNDDDTKTIVWAIAAGIVLAGMALRYIFAGGKAKPPPDDYYRQ